MSFASRFLRPVPSIKAVKEEINEHSPEAAPEQSVCTGIHVVSFHPVAEKKKTGEDEKETARIEDCREPVKVSEGTESPEEIDPVSASPLPPENTNVPEPKPAASASTHTSSPKIGSEKNYCDNFTIQSYFAEKGFDITISGSRNAIPAVENLAFGIALNFDASAPFIRYIRDCITKKHFENVSYYYGSCTPGEKTAAVQLAEKLADYGILSDVFVNKANSLIKVTISSAPRVINFLTGDFMELYAQSVVSGVLKKYEKEHGMKTELYTNALITGIGQQNELDLVFRVADRVFWAEIKSGKFNPDTYRLLGEHMGVVPDRLILLAAGKNNEQTDAIGYFYDFFCANVGTFKNKLIDMIEKAFKEDNYNV